MSNNDLYSGSIHSDPPNYSTATYNTSLVEVYKSNDPASQRTFLYVCVTDPTGLKQQGHIITVANELWSDLQDPTKFKEDLAGRLIANIQIMLPKSKASSFFDMIYTFIDSKESYRAIKVLSASTLGPADYSLDPYPNLNYSGFKNLPLDDSRNRLAVESGKLPGSGVKVPTPCECYPNTNDIELHTAIMHLNDSHFDLSAKIRSVVEWSTEEICNWLDELHDSGVVNLEIEIPDKEINI